MQKIGLDEKFALFDEHIALEAQDHRRASGYAAWDGRCAI
jgi:hypothetical protein